MGTLEIVLETTVCWGTMTSVPHKDVGAIVFAGFDSLATSSTRFPDCSSQTIAAAGVVFALLVRCATRLLWLSTHLHWC
jgi:hypothetical protein